MSWETCRRLVPRSAMPRHRSYRACHRPLTTERQRKAGLCAWHLAEQTRLRREADRVREGRALDRMRRRDDDGHDPAQ